MDETIKQFAEYLIQLFNRQSPEWESGYYRVVASSSVSVSFRAGPTLFDATGRELQFADRMKFIPDINTGKHLEFLFRNVNLEKKTNIIYFDFANKAFAGIRFEWDQTVQDKFDQFLSDTQKKEIKAWYLPDHEKNNEPAQMQLLPKNGVQMDTTALTLDKAFEQLNKAVTYQEDPLWDGGYYSITRRNGQWSGDCGLYLFNTLKSKENNWRADQVDCELLITEEMKTLFLFIQEQYKELNPAVSYDTLFVTVQSDAIRYTTNFELEGVEVSPNAPPMPEVVDASYLCQNLHNCLAYNAPDNYHWLYEVLKRTQTADGKTQLEGVFYYSLNEDKSAPQELEPGEYVYMYNVSQRLFDEFLPDTKGWTEIALYFSREGNVAYRVIKREDQ